MLSICGSRMAEIHIEVIGLIFSILLVLGFYIIVVPRMRNEMKNFTWNQYFKQCGIYQGTSHWTTIKYYLLRLRGWKKRFFNYFLLMSLSFLKHSSHRVLPHGILLPHALHLPCFTRLKPITISWSLVIHLNISLLLWILVFILSPRNMQHLRLINEIA